MAYIDREKFLKKSAECFGHFGVLVKAIEEIANECTEEDVVEVVRCKDCKHNADNGGDCDRVLIHTHRNLITETNEYQYFKLNCCEYGTPKERGGEKYERSEQ